MKDIEKAARTLYEAVRESYVSDHPRAAVMWPEWERLPRPDRDRWRSDVQRRAEREVEEWENNIGRLILEAAQGERVEFVTVNGKVLTWEDAKSSFNWGHRNGASDERPVIVAWTHSWVIITCEYDSSFWYDTVPRNPVDHEPRTYGR